MFHSSHYWVGHPPTHTPGQERPTTAIEPEYLIKDLEKAFEKI